MNILFLTRRFYPGIGGVEKHVLEVSKELMGRGHRITVITENPAPKSARRLSNYHLRDQSDIYSINSKETVKSGQIDNFEAKKVKIFRLNFGENNWLKKIRIWIKLVGYVNIIRDSDVVHCHDVFFWYFPFRFLFPTKKVFTTFHGFETKFPPTIKARLVRKISEKLSYGNICVGEYIRKWYGTKPNYVTYGGVKTQNSKIKTQNFDKRRKGLNILLVGRLDEDNGAKMYLKALKELRNRSISYNLVVCGDGQFKKQFEKYGKVEGFISDLNKYIDRSDFIFASSYLSILEALFRGKNVFGVYQNPLKEDYLKLSPFREFISISPDAYSLVEQLLNVWKGVDRSYNTRKRAYEWARAQTWTKVANIYLNLWRI